MTALLLFAETTRHDSRFTLHLFQWLALSLTPLPFCDDNQSVKRILLSPDPVDGSPAPDPAPAPAAPPAGKIVTEGGRTERELALEKDLNEERLSHAKTAGEKMARENRINELEDELRKLRAPNPGTPDSDKRSALERFMSGEDF